MKSRLADESPAAVRKPDPLLRAVSLHRAARLVDAMALFVRSCVRLVGACAALVAAIAALWIITGTLW